MSPARIIFPALFASFVAGCGPSAAERDAQEKARLEHEQKTRAEAQRANEAITDMNKKMFGKKHAPTPPPEPARKP